MPPSNRTTSRPIQDGSRRGHLATQVAGLLAALGLGVGIAATLSSCGDSASASNTAATANPTTQAPAWPEPRTLTDDAGAEVQLDRPATRVAVVSPAAADLLLDLGVTPVLVPALQFGPSTDAPERWAGIPTLRVSHGAGPSLESLAAANPDLVITTSTYARSTPAIQRTLGVPVMTLDVNHITDLERHAGLLADATDAAADARDVLISRLEQQRRVAVSETDQSDPVRVLAVFGGASGSHVFLDTSYLASLVEMLGGELVANDSAATSAYAGLGLLSLETAAESDPDIILVVAHGDATSRARDLANHPIWSTLRATKRGHVVPLPDGPVLLRPGTDVQQTIQLLRDAITSALAG